MAIVLIHFYLQHLKLYCLFLGNACKMSSGFFQLGYCPNEALKSCFTYTPQISLLYDNIGEIIASNILQAWEGFNLLKFVCFLKLKRILEYYDVPDFDPNNLSEAKIKHYIDIIKQKYITYWQHTIHHSKKLQFYSLFKHDYKISSYLDLIRNSTNRKFVY